MTSSANNRIHGMEIARLKPNSDWVTLSLFDRSGWERVRFGDVVANVNETCSPAEACIERFIGLDHMEPGSLHISRWGDVADGTTFTRRCKPGQVLFGKRRAYQRKVAVAEFDAVVSGDIYVFAPKDDRLLPELLPFICMSERFFRHAVGTSAGSLSPRTNWSSLAGYEFDLPPLDQQRRIAEILWAVDEVSDGAIMQHKAAQHLLQAAVDDVFAKNTSCVRAGYGYRKLDELTTKIVDGVHKTPNYTQAGVSFIVIENLSRGQGIDFADTRFISQQDHDVYWKRANPEHGDVLVSKDGTLGISRFVDCNQPFSIFVSIALLKPNRELLDGRLLTFYFRSQLFWEHVRKTSAGSALKHILIKDFKSAPFPILSLDTQRQFADHLAQIESVVCLADRHVNYVHHMLTDLMGVLL